MSQTKNIINEILDYTARLKSENVFEPVTVIVPSVGISDSFYRLMKENKINFLNFRIENFRQFVHRVTEPVLYSQNKTLLSAFDSYFTMEELISKLKLSAYSTAKDFASYSLHFQFLINEISLNLTSEEFEKAIKTKENSVNVKKLNELFTIYKAYLKTKNTHWDYSDLCQNFPKNPENLILFPEVADHLSKFEYAILSKCKSCKMDYQFKNEYDHSIISFTNPLYSKEEIRSVFREILSKKIPFHEAVIIAPDEYFDMILTEATVFNIPINCEASDSFNIQSCFFISVLEVIESDFSFESISYFLRLKKQYFQLNELLKLAVAVGKDVFRKTLSCKMEEFTPENQPNKSFIQLKDTLEKLFQLDEKQSSPHDFGKFLIDTFLTGSVEKSLIQLFINDLKNRKPDIEFENWAHIVKDRIPKIRKPVENQKNALLITNNTLPGSFSYIFFLGLKESAFPEKYRENPLITDTEIEFLNKSSGAKIKTSLEKNFQSQNRISLSMHCAEKAWIGSFPYQDIISGSPEFISFPLLPFLIEQSKLNKMQNINEYFLKIRSNPGAMLKNRLFTKPDWYFFYLNQMTENTKPFLSHILASHESAMNHNIAESSYWGNHFDNRSGIISENYKKRKTVKSYFSVTSDFEKFMKCPYLWFLKNELGVKELNIPVPVENIGPMDIGILVHKILEEYMKLNQGKTKRNVKTLEKIMDKNVKEETEKVGTVHPFYIEKLKSDVNEILSNFIEFEKNLAISAPDRIPKYFEYSFGNSSEDEPPLEMIIKNHKVFIKGKIDRIDIGPEDAFVLDYKTGKSEKYKPEKFEGGKKLQPSLYAYAVKKLLGDEIGSKKIYTGFLALIENQKEKLIIETEKRETIFLSFIEYVVTTINKGMFFQSGNCENCSYTSICGNLIKKSCEKKFYADKKYKEVEKYLVLSDIE